MFVEIHTDQGLTGIGPGLNPALLPAAKAQLVGRDPFDIEEHAARLRYYAGGASLRLAAGKTSLRFGGVGRRGLDGRGIVFGPSAREMVGRPS